MGVLSGAWRAVRAWAALLSERLGPKGQTVVGGLLSVVILTVVVVVGSALSSPQTTQPPDIGLGANDAALAQALVAIESGETTAAAILLEQTLEEDPGNQQARRTLDSLRAGSGVKPGSDGDALGYPEPGSDKLKKPARDDSAFDKPIEDITKLLPSASEEFDLGPPTAMGDDATVSGTPADPGMFASKSQWTVHYRKSNKDARAFVEETSKSLHPNNARTMEIDGASAYFGTDGTRFATVVYVRGRYVFEAVLTTLSGKPSSLQEEAIRAAKDFPDTP